jgi:excisionase family DNA binding protein
VSDVEPAGRERLPTRATLTVVEAAEVLGISRGLAYELVRSGDLPSLRLGRCLVIPRRVVEELLASVTVGSVAAGADTRIE